MDSKCHNERYDELDRHGGNDKKLLSGEGEIEFLRKLTLNDGIIYGYLNRSIPNLVCKDL